MLKADANQFAGLQGTIVLTTEFAHTVLDATWNGTGIDVTQVGMFPAQPEDGIFVTAAIIHPTTPEPSSMLLLGSGVLGLAQVLRRKLM